MLIHNGDHAQYEIDNAGIPPQQRSDWPYSSFNGDDWAHEFVRRHPGFCLQEARSWFASALMRGYDEHASRARADHAASL